MSELQPVNPPSIWQTLHLEATADVIAIKRAYAQQLKRTRPDDDPAGYQRLREARDQALLQARWWRENAKDEDDAEDEADEEDASTGATAALYPVDSAAAAERKKTVDHAGSSPLAEGNWSPRNTQAEQGTDGNRNSSAFVTDDGLFDSADDVLHTRGEQQPDAPETPPAPVIIETDDLADTGLDWHTIQSDLHQLLLQLLQQWPEKGDEPAAWPHLLDRLHELPLGLNHAASALCGRFALEHRDMPPQLFLRLAEHFHWGSDFRADARLGAMALILAARRQQAKTEIEEARRKSQGFNSYQNLSWTTRHNYNWVAPQSLGETERQQLADVFRLNHLDLKGRRLFAFFHALLAPASLGEQVRQSQLSLPLAYITHRDRLETLVNAAAVLRSLLLIAIFAWFTGPFDESTPILSWLIMSALMAFTLWGAGAITERCSGIVHQWLPRAANFLDSSHLRFVSALLLSLLLGLCGGIVALHQMLEQSLFAALFFGGPLLSAVVLVLIWPREPAIRPLILPLSVLLSIVAWSDTDGGLLPATGFGLAWMTLLLWIHNNFGNFCRKIADHPLIALKQLLRWLKPTRMMQWILAMALIQLWMTLAFVAIAFLTPLLPMLMAQRCSRHVGLAAVALALGVTLFPVADAGPQVLFRLPLAALGIGALLLACHIVWRLLRFDRVPHQPPAT